MDNNMTAIVCVLMIGLGFINGITVSQLLDFNQVGDLRQRLKEETELVVRLQQTIDDLEEELTDAQVEKEEMLNEMIDMLGRHSRLAPPPLKLQRQPCAEDAESEAVTPPCETSPDATS